MIALWLDANTRFVHILHCWAFDGPLLAASGKSPQTVVLGLGLGLSIILTVLFSGFYLLARYRRSRLGDDPKALFRELCRVHDLSGGERRLLKRLATGLELTSPSALFVDSSLWRLPDTFDRHHRIKPTDWDRLLKVQRTIFLPPPAKVVA